MLSASASWMNQADTYGKRIWDPGPKWQASHPTGLSPGDYSSCIYDLSVLNPIFIADFGLYYNLLSSLFNE